MFKILIVGHANLPKGTKAAIELILGKQSNLYHQNISIKNGHSDFEQKIAKFYKKHHNILVVADLTGGAPHQICVRKMMEHKDKNIFVISGVSLAFLIELVINPLKNKNKSENYKTLNYLLQETWKLARIIKA